MSKLKKKCHKKLLLVSKVTKLQLQFAGDKLIKLLTDITYKVGMYNLMSADDSIIFKEC